MGKTVIVTGSSGNLGAAVVKKLLNAGYKVLPVRHTDVNLQDEKATGVFIAELIRVHGKIDGVVCLAGGFAMGGLKETDGEALRKMISLNFETAYFVVRPVFQHMLESGFGRLVLIGAGGALRPEAGHAMMGYALSKRMLFDLSDLLNASAKGKNVKSVVVAPGTIDTPVNRKAMPNADTSTWVSPEDLANMIEALLSGKGVQII
jgi:NAD(P)-dependent dehydrogenase (short-subunit alcohol dehydrogenase family)